MYESVGPITKAAFNQNTAATHEAVAGVTGDKPRLIGLHLVAADAVTITLAMGDTTIYGPVNIGANGVLDLVPSPSGHGPDGAAGEAFNITLGGAVQVGGCVAVQHIK